VIAFPSRNIDKMDYLIEHHGINCIVFTREKDIDSFVSAKLDSLGAKLIHFSAPDPNASIRIYKL
jgi:hypothetical protein